MRNAITSIGIICLFFLVGILPSVDANSADSNVVRPLTMGETITVDDDRVECPTAMFTELYDAIMCFENNYPYYTEINVYTGEYDVKSSNEQHYIFSSNLILRGVDGALKTTIDGNGIGESLVIYGNNIEVSGFTIKNHDKSCSGIRVGGDGSGHPNNIKIHDNIFYLRDCLEGAYGLSLEGQYSNVEIYSNDFVSDGEDSGYQQNAIDSQGTGYWHDNLWREWDGIWDNAQQGDPYEKNGVVDSSPSWEPHILSRPSGTTVNEEKISGRTYQYRIVSYDADNDGVYYEVKWGDDGEWTEWEGIPGTYPWDGFLPQGETVTVLHKFKIGQKHMVTVDVCDEHLLWCREPTVLKLSYDRGIFSLFFEKLLEKFPILNKFLSRL